MSRRVVCVVTDTAVHAALCESRGRDVTVVDHGRVSFDAPDSLLVEHDPEALASAVTEAVSRLGSSSQPVTLVLPMQWSFVEVLPSNEARLTPDSLRFELERFLPLPLEEVACGFEVLDQGQILAAALPVEPMKRLLERLTERGVSVEMITMDATAARHGSADHAESSGVVLRDVRWQRFLGRSSGPEYKVGVSGRIRHDAGTSGTLSPMDEDGDGDGTGEVVTGWIVLELNAHTTGDVATQAERTDASESTLTKHIGMEALAVIAEGVYSPSLLDLRTGALAADDDGQRLARRAARILATALVLLAAFLAGTQLELRAVRSHLQTLDRQRSGLYRTVFDGQPIPPEAALRVASERVRLEGLTGRNRGSERSVTGTLPAPLEVLRGFVAALPPETRIYLDEARLDENQLLLRGQTVEHRDAERIAEAVSAAPGVEARPPRTTRIKSGGVEFTISGGPEHGR